MPLWEYPIHEITRRLDCRQWAFLTAPARDLHVAILVVLYQAREQETLHELPFDLLYERLNPIVETLRSVERYDASALRTTLNQLEVWGNVAMRLEPRRVRSISDRGLKLLLVRLSESTNGILEHLESQLEEIEHEGASSARFSLLEVDDALQSVSALTEHADRQSEEDFCRAGRKLFRARQAVEEAGHELLRLDLWLSATAMRPPDRERLLELLSNVETYFDRYLCQVDERRERCFEKLSVLLTESSHPFLIVIEQALKHEFADDPTRSGRRPPEIRPLLQIISDFLKPYGILDCRRMVVHQRLADVVGHLRRHLSDIVRRSRLVSLLRALSHNLLCAPQECFTEDIDALFLRLWQPAHAVLDESAGIPTERAVLPRPHIYRPSGKRRFTGASIRPSANGHGATRRPTLIKQMADLNEFVFRVVLRGQREALVGNATLNNFGDVRLLMSAIRMARLEKSRIRERYLRYKVDRTTTQDQLVLTLGDGSGQLCLPQLIFTAE